MDKGDFFVHFMDLTEEELKKQVDDIIPPRLEALLELALRMSTANTDPFKDDLKVLDLFVLGQLFSGRIGEQFFEMLLNNTKARYTMALVAFGTLSRN